MPQTNRSIEYTVEYTVGLDAPQTQMVEMRMVVRYVTTPTIEVALPVWRAGRYAILNPAGTLHNVRAQRPDGSSLPISKLDKTTWQVQTAGSPEIEVRYTVYANSLADRTRHVDDTHAFLSGAAVFLYVPERRDDALSVRVNAPADWKLSCGLDSAPDDPHLLLAPNYDALVDAPIEAGLQQVHEFEVESIPHQIVLWGAPPHDAEKLKQDFAAIVRQESAIFGGLPYRRYIFMIHVMPGIGGGTEHFNSTIMHVTPAVFENENDYRRLLYLASHELFHAWNVKRLRPAALARTDFTRENYTDLLWFCEGTTSYYDELMLVRAGLTPSDSYIEMLSELIHKVRRRPGSKVQSLAESSFDAWIKFNQPTPDEMNSTVSFYDGGAVASFLFDLELRARSDNRVSLDTLMRAMFLRFPVSGAGFTEKDLIEMADQLTRSSFDDFFARYVRGTEIYPLENRVGVVGLKLELSPMGIKPYSGLFLHEQNSATVVRFTLSDGPAYSAGVLAGDEIVALNGRRYESKELMVHIEQHMIPGELVHLEVIRRGRQHVVEFELGSAPRGRWQLSRIESPTETQRTAYQDWLHQPWPGTI